MSEAKSLVVWLPPWKLPNSLYLLIEVLLGPPNVNRYEYAHDLSGRFLGVFREVRA